MHDHPTSHCQAQDGIAGWLLIISYPSVLQCLPKNPPRGSSPELSFRFRYPTINHIQLDVIKSAHTALAVKACLLGCKTATLNAQVTFVNIAVAISALAGGGHSKNFAPSLYIAGVFAFVRRFFGVGDQDGTEIEFWVILVLLWTEFWVILVALWCNSYSCRAFKSGKSMKRRGCYSTKK